MVNKIFQIGFNKTGSLSIYKFLKQNGIPSVHHDRGKLSKTIYNNYMNNEPLLKGYEKYQGFTDMEHTLADGGFFYASEQYFTELDKQYPNSLFIMNFRNIDSWIKSRLNHGNGKYLFNAMLASGLTRDEVEEQWKKEYRDHMNNVKEYFKDRDDILFLELENENKNILGEFLNNKGLDITHFSLGFYHKTKLKTNNINLHIENIRDAALYFETIDITQSLKLMKVAKQFRPKGGFINDRIKKYESYITKQKNRRDRSEFCVTG